MSIKSEIDRIQANVAAAYEAVSDRGGTVPQEANSENLHQAVNSIPAGITQDELQTALAEKQDKLDGVPGQVVGFDADGNAVAQDALDTGVTSFNGRTGEVTPQAGDYTAAQVGALSTTGTAAAATKLATARTIRTNLASTTAASFDGTANVTPGVTGTLPLANGGTGSTTAAAALTALGALPTAGGTMTGTIISSLTGSDTKPDFQSSVFTQGSLLKLYMNGGKAAIRFGKGSSAPASADRLLVRGVASPSDASDAANKEYVDGKFPVSLANGGTGATTAAAALTALGAASASHTHSYLPLSGGTMTGAIAMGSKKITGLASGTASTDAVNLGQMFNRATSIDYDDSLNMTSFYGCYVTIYPLTNITPSLTFYNCHINFRGTVNATAFSFYNCNIYFNTNLTINTTGSNTFYGSTLTTAYNASSTTVRFNSDCNFCGCSRSSNLILTGNIAYNVKLVDI